MKASTKHEASLLNDWLGINLTSNAIAVSFLRELHRILHIHRLGPEFAKIQGEQSDLTQVIEAFRIVVCKLI